MAVRIQRREDTPLCRALCCGDPDLRPQKALLRDKLEPSGTGGCRSFEAPGQQPSQRLHSARDTDE